MHVQGRNRVSDVPPKAFLSISDAYIEQKTCGKHRHVYRLGDLFCVARTPVQAADAYFKSKGIDPTEVLSAQQIRRLMEAESPISHTPVFAADFAE